MSGFDKAAPVYELRRPSYPDEAVTCLVDRLDITHSSTVLDLAAGTGKLTRLLDPHAGAVIAVEPVDGMREILKLHVPKAEVLDGRAEAIPVESDSVDAVTVAQAFHWFAESRVLKEIARVLRPGGRLGLIWNVRDETQPAQAAFTAMLDRHRVGTPTFRTSRWQALFDDSRWFSPIESAAFPYVHWLDRVGFYELVKSVSYMSGLSRAADETIVEDVRRLFDGLTEFDDEGRAPLDYTTRVYWSRLR